jgi:predicted nucleic acid-binding protein
VFLKGVQLLNVHWVTQDEHLSAVEMLERRSRRNLSLVDCVSFVVMREHGVTTALAYDADFEREGFTT